MASSIGYFFPPTTEDITWRTVQRSPEIVYRRNRNGADSVEHVHSQHELMLTSVIIVRKIMYMRNPYFRQ
jgi:hypothetical protein